MSQMIDFTLPSSAPGRMLHAFRCVPEGEVRAIVQLSHGMVEFIDRYKPLAAYLAARGILVTGKSLLRPESLCTLCRRIVRCNKCVELFVGQAEKVAHMLSILLLTPKNEIAHDGYLLVPYLLAEQG